jgi:hypothetical protein
MHMNANKIKSIVTSLLLSFGVVFGSPAQDNDRIRQLEKEVVDLSARVAKLESLLVSPVRNPEVANAGEGWKSLANWRKLLTDMSLADVRKILGEPERINGGEVANWYYPNRGSVTFIRDRAVSWTEPRK